MTNKFWKQGEPFVWATGLSLSVVVLLTGLLLYVVIINGMVVFWPSEVSMVELADGSRVIGEIKQREESPQSEMFRYQFKTGNRDLYGIDFRWIDGTDITAMSKPADIIVLERQEYGNFYGFLKSVDAAAHERQSSLSKEGRLTAALKDLEAKKNELEGFDRIISSLNNRLEHIQNKLAKIKYRGAENSAQAAKLQAEQSSLKAEFDTIVTKLNKKREEASRHGALFVDANGTEKRIPLLDIVRFYQPNAMSLPSKLLYYLSKTKELFLAEPRESNTEGGLFPAIFGTIMLVFLMSILSFPFGVISGIYLREYAKQDILVRIVRIAVNNLAGIPSIVYGIFGLGFFVYGVGGSIDQLFFPEKLPTPTFGTGGILWASMTLGLLTVPVVIVATEEALGAIPPGIREGSQALAATKFQTLIKLLLPMASPGILTGFILAMARAAGEIAPLMITGVVKLAPALAIDTNYPYLHLDRKFMHLGFHIYDIGFQSPNVEAAKPMVYVTTLLLIMIVLVMTSTAIHLRNKMRKRYAVTDV